MLEKNAKWVVILAVAISSPASIFSRLCGAPSMVMAMYRMLFAVIILLPVVLRKHWEELRHLKIKNVVMCILSGIFFAMHLSCYFEAMRHTTIAAGTVLTDTEVLFVALALLLLFHEKIPGAGLIGIAITFLGSIVIALGDHGAGSNILLGDFLALGAAIASAGYTLVGRTQRKGMTTNVYTFLVYLSTCITLAMVCLITGQSFTGYSLSDYGWIMAMVIFCTFLGHSVYSWSLKYVSAAFVTTAKLAEPVFAAMLATILFAEIPSWNQIIGGVIILAGLIIYLRVKEERESE